VSLRVLQRSPKEPLGPKVGDCRHRSFTGRMTFLSPNQKKESIVSTVCCAVIKSGQIHMASTSYSKSPLDTNASGH